MGTQLHPRIAKRMPCSVRSEGKRHAGLVLNVSQGGLFVQTNANTAAGEEVNLRLSHPEGGEPIPVRARVVWRRVVPQQLRTSAKGGLGVRIEQADESYFRLLAAWMRIEARHSPRPERAAAAPAAEPPAPRFGVRLLAARGTRSRRVDVAADSEEDARAMALRQLGAGWRVIEVIRRRE